MGDYVTCTVCGEDVGRMAIATHAGMHKREFRERYGRAPDDYDEVRAAFGGEPPGDVTTLADFA